jgi:hypothetical protein
MGRRKRGAVRFDVVTGLANDLQIADHGILNQCVLHVRRLGHALGVAFDALNGFDDVGQLAAQALLVVVAHDPRQFRPGGPALALQRGSGPAGHWA